MIDFEKTEFIGRTAIFQKRAQGVEKKIIGIKADASVADLPCGSSIVSDGISVGQVQAACFSYAINAWIGLALFPVEIAYAGLTFHLGESKGVSVATISMPPIIPKSLSVKLDEL